MQSETETKISLSPTGFELWTLRLKVQRGIHCATGAGSEWGNFNMIFNVHGLPIGPPIVRRGVNTQNLSGATPTLVLSQVKLVRINFTWDRVPDRRVPLPVI